jgi:aspartate kinase
MKFGGTSVGDVAAFERVYGIVSSQLEGHPVVVVSAMTKVTDALLAAFETAKKGEFAEAFASLEPHFERHVQVSKNFIPDGTPNAFSAELDFARDELSDVLMRDSRRLIVTDDEYGAATPIIDETNELVKLELEPLIAAGEVPIMGGFIAASKGGETTTLGRGGSDYSAALVAAALHASVLQIWTDVTGVMTCDPRICGDARTIPTLSYEEAAELAYFGAKVLHPKTIKPAVDNGIPVRVCNTFEPNEVGTMVLDESGEAPNTIKSIAHKKNITILRITSARMLGSYGFMSAVFQVFDRYRTVIDVISTSEVSIALTLDNTADIDKIVDELRRLGDAEAEPGYAVICVVGEGLRASTGLASKIFSTIDDVNIALVSHGASAVNLTFVVKEELVADVIKKLHGEFF